MKIVDAVWEKRNLGVSTVEVTFEKDDVVEDALDTLSHIDAQYTVLRVPSFRADILAAVQDIGFKYVEDMINLVSKLEEIHRSPLEQRFYDAVTVELMNDEDMEVLRQEIAKGLFDTDRVYFDPHFTREQATARYINWVNDEKARGTKFYKHIYKNKTIGFFGLRETENKHFTSFLGGIYKEHRTGGIGAVVKVPEVVKANDGKMIQGAVSSNNPAQIRNLIKNGYLPESIMHVLIRHR